METWFLSVLRNRKIHLVHLIATHAPWRWSGACRAISLRSACVRRVQNHVEEVAVTCVQSPARSTGNHRRPPPPRCACPHRSPPPPRCACPAQVSRTRGSAVTPHPTPHEYSTLLKWWLSVAGTLFHPVVSPVYFTCPSPVTS